MSINAFNFFLFIVLFLRLVSLSNGCLIIKMFNVEFVSSRDFLLQFNFHSTVLSLNGLYILFLICMYTCMTIWMNCTRNVTGKNIWWRKTGTSNLLMIRTKTVTWFTFYWSELRFFKTNFGKFRLTDDIYICLQKEGA